METAGAPIPARPTLTSLRRAADGCRACDLYRNATQTVFGEGPRGARMMLVGEQPGDREDVEGQPFVGPAGRLLDRALEDAGIDRKQVYLTNAVKHFKWEPRGKRRIHKKPDLRELMACRPWLEAELAVVRPEVVVAMGATAARSLLGPAVRVTRDRGHPLESDLAAAVFATVHPSALLRAPDEEARRREDAAFVSDLHTAASAG